MPPLLNAKTFISTHKGSTPGSIIGFPSFFTPAKFGGGMSNEINFWIATAVTLVVAFGCTWAFGFKDADVAAEKKVVRRKTIGKDA